jgi:hypothetical protein
MRYHHGYGCYGHGGWYGGCGPEPGWGPGPGYGYGWWDAPYDDPLPYRRRTRPMGGAARQSAASRLEAYVASLRDEIRAVEQDLRDLRESADDAPDRPLE